jgi:hypothetical protein
MYTIPSVALTAATRLRNVGDRSCPAVMAARIDELSERTRDPAIASWAVTAVPLKQKAARVMAV